MADEEQPQGGTAKEEKKHTKQQRMLIVIGIVSLVLVYVMMRRSSGSSSNASQLAAQQAAAAQLAAQQGAYGSAGSPYYAPGNTAPYGMANDPVAMTMLADLQHIQSQLTGGATMSAGGPSGGGGGNSQTPSVPKSAPAEPGIGLFGTSQLLELQHEVASGQLSTAAYTDVANAYQAAGPLAATEHFVYNGPGNVTTIPAIH